MQAEHAPAAASEPSKSSEAVWADACIDNGKAVPCTLIGGANNVSEVETILEFRPKTPKRTGQLRKVKGFSCQVAGARWGVNTWQPWSNLKGYCDDA